MSEDYNHPSRTDYYLMQLAAMWSAKEIKQLNELKVSFITNGGSQPKRTTPGMVDHSKFGWLSAMTGELTVVQR